MKIETKNYPAKLLLFGEYTIIKNGSALAFPLSNYYGNWAFSKTVNNENLFSWISYINKIQQANNLDCQIDIQKFTKDLKNGLYFNSTIPIGYGVGSSGALCAALLEEYRVLNTSETLKNDTIFTLKTIFQSFENFFHGSSSGIDPLICYLNQPILLKGKNEASTITLKQPLQNGGAIFLLDTEQPRQTEPLVNYFLDKLKTTTFATQFENEWCIYNERIIQSFLNQNYKSLFRDLRLLSQFQLEHLPPMIPKGFEQLWTKSLESNDFVLKLCGAGGGGFILGFTEDWQQTINKLSDYTIIKIRDL